MRRVGRGDAARGEEKKSGSRDRRDTHHTRRTPSLPADCASVNQLGHLQSGGARGASSPRARLEERSWTRAERALLRQPRWQSSVGYWTSMRGDDCERTVSFRRCCLSMDEDRRMRVGRACAMVDVAPRSNGGLPTAALMAGWAGRGRMSEVVNTSGLFSLVLEAVIHLGDETL